MTNKHREIVIKIKTTGLELPPVIEEYVRAKVGMLQKFFPHYAKESGKLIFEVEVGKTTKHHRTGDVFRAEINFNADGASLRSEATKDDLHAAIDEAKDEMQREMRKHKNREQSLFKRGGTRIKDFLRQFSN